MSQARPRPSQSRSRRPARPAALDLTLSASTGKAYLPYLRRHLLAAHALLRPALRELSVALVGDQRMSLLHEQFMDIKGPTDVLTFELDHDAKGRVTSGEVVVCVPEARRQSARRKTGVQRELLLYALHGMLHLTGYDDITEDEYRKMHQKEDDILRRLGVGPVFQPKQPVETNRRQRRTGAK